MIWTIVSWIVLGLVAGALARLLVPGPDPMSILSTVLLGVAGSFVGGFLGYALFDKDLGEGALQPSGIVGSILGAIVLVLLRRVFTRRSVRS
ncbi:GlsB/YeaQ/YmgE family stress response membrane protein [Frankia nepalensis]|uniref:GlsB/YeaQ/YmgE family stress response membrane protein n=1 Tax=Frankia nepalensis TaxID=1836974 RepID=A0A937UP80_9ACTN|nr:GlsB/YeaQ/YmgE family stress response membrane protein [Frankia nepalensis]MBL7501926.1 GlsB/YeaQ/YmgE family stress response membrane protein [Frankia nepalensis]MBL7514527.1 GlsB/YeaQ/YmgE family stress response membrane protein [Frankia nepalensis]MBL7628802.1 GlsB/YeaQ/YmgE family stress response membrane protein [Frankia nepalensis]